MANRPSRKLAVLLHADVVGSTTLVQQDEALAHERIQAAFHRFSELIRSYGGTAHEIRGDALVAEFDRASDAVSAALAFQTGNTEFNATLDDDIRPQLRIGISMGEVVIADRTVTGAGVVLAQRLEQFAEPGGVCVQGAAYETVPKRLPFEYESLGEQQVKGFEDPVRAYAVKLKRGEAMPRAEPRTEAAEAVVGKPVWSRITGGIIALLIVVVGGLAWWQPWVPREEPASIERMALSLPDKPSIAVLPFTNMSGDPKQEYFVDGMTEDLITDLSKLSGLFVIARNSVFTYKGKPVKVRRVAEELGVRYVLEGSVRRADAQVRINAQLIDATTGGHLWADRYDGNLKDVFSLQDKITSKIVTALSVHLMEDEARVRSKVRTDNPQAHVAFLKGWEHYRRDSTEHYAKAMEYFQQAIVLDPEYSQAHAAIASIYWKSYVDEFHQVFRVESVEARERAQEILKRTESKPNSLAYQVASEINLWRHKHEAAISSGEKAISLDPNSASARLAFAKALIFSGRPGDALDLIDSAERLDPFGKARYEFVRGMALFGMGDYKRAAVSLERARELNPNDWAADDPGETWCYPCEILASAYGHLGRQQDANTIIAYMHSYWPNYRIGGITPYWHYKNSADTERLSAGLRKAGLPE